MVVSFVSGYGGGSVSDSKSQDLSPNFPILPPEALAAFRHLHST